MLPAPTPEEIVSVSCNALGVSVTEFMGRSRHGRIVDARRLCVWLMRQHTTLSYPEMARKMGRPNHSTIITLHQRISELVAAGDGDWAKVIGTAEAELARLVAARDAEDPIAARRPMLPVLNGETNDLTEQRLRSAETGLADLRRIHREEETAIEHRIRQQRDAFERRKELARGK